MSEDNYKNVEVFFDGIPLPKLDVDCYNIAAKARAGIEEQILKRHFQQIDSILREHCKLFPEDIDKYCDKTTKYDVDGTLIQIFSIEGKPILKVVYPKFDPFKEMKIVYFMYPKTGDSECIN